MDQLTVIQLTREIGLKGGIEVVAYELHRAWLAKGVDARVMTGNVTEVELPPGVIYTLPRLHRWSPWPRLRRFATLLREPLFTLIATLRVWRKHRSAIVVSHGDALIGDVCVIHSVHLASLIEKQRAGHYGWLLNPIHLWVLARDWWMLGGGRYRRVVAISERVRRELKEHYRLPDERIVMIPNGINLARFTPHHAGSRVSIRRELKIPLAAPLLLFVANEYQRKGLAYVIKALARMKTQAYLLVVGNDSEVSYQRLAEQCGVSRRVVFAGRRSDLELIYPAADLFVLPTYYEAHPLVCLEAMASGLPMLATPVGGIEDYLRDGDNGLYIRRDPADIAAKADRVLNDPTLHARFRERGLATAQGYAWEQVAEQYLDLFNELKREREVVALRGTPIEIKS